MTASTSIGVDDPRDASPDTRQSGIDDEERERKQEEGGDAASAGKTRDLTREDIESGNDQRTSADQLARAPRTNKLHDDGIDLGNT